MKRTLDVSGEHFDWLVEGRSRNQRSALALYKIIAARDDDLLKSVVLHRTARDLVAIGFSLWRAVFLSDLTEDPVDRLTDVRTFLQSLIAHNAIVYQTDFTTREWTFEYYLENALFRLNRLSPDILPSTKLRQVTGSAKEQWSNVQASLDFAITSFAEMIADRAAR